MLDEVYDLNRIYVDLDNTLAHYYPGDEDARLIRDPIPGAVDALEILCKKYVIIIWTSRRDTIAVRAWLKLHGVCYHRLINGPDAKPPPTMILDDRAFGMMRPFTRRDWQKVLKKADMELTT